MKPGAITEALQMQFDRVAAESAGGIAVVGTSPIWLDWIIDGIVILKFIAVVLAVGAGFYVLLRARNQYLRDRAIS